jgi:hypothetical protein
MGWHRHEFDFMGIPFEGRGRGDEAIRLMRASWNGERDFEAQSVLVVLRSTAGRTRRRSRRSGSVAARSAQSGGRSSRGRLACVVRLHADHVRSVKERNPALRVIPRIAPVKVDAMLEAGAEGTVVSFADEVAMRNLARCFR